MTRTNIERIISEKIQPYSLNEEEKAKIAQLVQKYPESLLLYSIDCGASTYFRYAGEKLTEESVKAFLENLGGIAYNKSLPPKEQEIRYLKNTLKKKFSNEYCADAEELLRNYFDELTLQGYSETSIVGDLSRKMMRIINNSKDFNEWRAIMVQCIEDIHKKPDTGNIVHNNFFVIDMKSLLMDLSDYMRSSQTSA